MKSFCPIVVYGCIALWNIQQLKFHSSAKLKRRDYLSDESLTSLAKKVPDLLDYSDNNGLIDYSGNVNEQLYALFGIDDQNQQHIKEVLASKNNKE